MLRFKGRPDFAVLIIHVAIDDLEVAVHYFVDRIEIVVCRFGPVMISPLIFVFVGYKP